MSERSPRARSVRQPLPRGAQVAAFTAVLAVGGALFVRAPAVQDPAVQSPVAPDPAAPAQNGDDAPTATTTATAPATATTAMAVTAARAAVAPLAPLAASPGSRQVFDPKDILLHGPSEPLIPPVIFVDAEISPRGALTAEPLTPPVVQVDIELAPRGTMTAEPIVPPTIEDTTSPASPARR